MHEAKRILVVEDDWLLASELSRRLRAAGYELVGPVPAVADAMKRIDEIKPDAAILDVQLSGETTLSLAAHLDKEAVPLLFLSGHSVADFPELDGRAVIPKPADWDKVLAALETSIHGSC